MHFTENAVTLFKEAFARVGKDICHIGVTTHRCGGKGLDVQLIDREEATRIVEIDGLPIDVSQEDEAFLSDITFDGEGNRIKIILPNAPANREHKEDCGCGGSCDEGCEGCDSCEGCGEQ